MTAPPVPPSNIDFRQLQRVCATCSLRELCLPRGLLAEEIERLDRLVYTRKRIKRGENLYRAGDPFGSLYAVRTGFFKSNVIADDGRYQVTGFYMPGDILGLDGISTERHAVDATALEASEVCVIPFARLEDLAHQVRSLQSHFHQLLSREIVRDQGIMLLLGTRRAEERVAAFLVDLSERFSARGYSAAEFNLRMTREELGSFLGLKLETVSRIFAKFQAHGLIAVRQKRIRILDSEGLRRVSPRASE